MRTKYLSLVIVAIIFSMVMIVPSDMTQTADAAKAKGVKNQQYGQATNTKVCGDRLCTSEDFTKLGIKKDQVMQGRHYKDLGKKLGFPVTYADYQEDQGGIFTSDWLRT